MSRSSPNKRSIGAGVRHRVIVTGGAGFVGGHLVERLLMDGAHVLVIDNLSTGRAANVPTGADLERLDIAHDELDGLFHSWRPDAVFHLAAQASVPASVEDPVRDLAVNVAGTFRVCAAARDAGALRLVFVSSGGAIYGDTDRPASERTRPAPASPYGVHKLAAEGHVAISGLSYAIARPSNIYGPRQIAGLDGAVIVSFVEQAVSSGTLHIHGDGSQTRDFIDVRDVVEGLHRLSLDNSNVGTWNVASGRRVAISELAELIELAVAHPLTREYLPRRAGDVAHSSISAARLRALGWQPTRRLANGVPELVRLIGQSNVQQDA